MERAVFVFAKTARSTFEYICFNRVQVQLPAIETKIIHLGFRAC